MTSRLPLDSAGNNLSPKAIAEWNEFDDLYLKLRTNIEKMKTLKISQLQSKSNDTPQIMALHQQILLLFTYLKRLQHKSVDRRSILQEKLQKLSATAKSKTQHFQNSSYIKNHALKNISICKEVPSGNLQKMKNVMISKNEYLAANPNSNYKKSADHKLFSDRLQFELKQRKELLEELQKVKKIYDIRHSEYQKKKEFLSTLNSKVGEIFQAMKPLKKHMKLPSSMIHPNMQNIDKLPAQLFSIYHIFRMEMHSNLDIDQRIEIEVKSTQKNSTILGKRSRSSIIIVSSDEENEEKLEDGEINHPPPLKKQKLSKKNSNQNEINSTKIENESDEQLIDEMCLRIIFKSINVSLEFYYCSKLNLVLMKVERFRNQQWSNEDPALFISLFKGYSIIPLPLEFIELKLKNNSSFVPFIVCSWVQELSGAYIVSKQLLPTLNYKRMKIKLEMIENALKSRVENRISLSSQVKEMSSKMNKNEHGFPLSSMAQMKEIFGIQIPMRNCIRSFILVNNKNWRQKIKSGWMRSDLENGELILNEFCHYFQLILGGTKGQKNVCLIAMVEVLASFPDPMPMFFIDIQDGNELFFVNAGKNIEIVMNSDFSYLENAGSDLLLLAAIFKLQLCFDKYLEANAVEEQNLRGFGSGSNMVSGGQERMFSGRDRRLQF